MRRPIRTSFIATTEGKGTRPVRKERHPEESQINIMVDLTAAKRRRTIQERREIVEETLVAGASVSRVARRHDVNANQVFYWRKLYREGRLAGRTATQLLAVKVMDSRSAEAAQGDGLALRSGTMEIKLAKGTVRIAGCVDVMALRAVLECLT